MRFKLTPSYGFSLTMLRMYRFVCTTDTKLDSDTIISVKKFVSKCNRGE